MSKTINLKLSSKSIESAIAELDAYKTELIEKQDLLVQKVSELGLQVASVKFSGAIYSGTNDVVVSVIPTEDGCAIVANGNAVCFIEFGTGVFNNTPDRYPNRPEWVSPIGEYGKGLGKRKGWVYRGDPGNGGTIIKGDKVLTHGDMATMPMYYASKEMKDNLERIAREVFGQ